MANLRTPPLPSHPSARAASQARGAAAFDDNDDGFGLEWRKYPMEELFSALQTSPRGLASAGLLVVCGGNELESKKQSKILAFLPLSVEAAVVTTVVGLARGGGQVDFGYALLALLAVGYAERKSAEESTAAALVARLAPSRRAFWVLRDGMWSGQDAEALVLGDIIHIRSGDVVPVDVRLLESPPVTIKIDESVLTGKALPAAKGPGDAVYAGSSCAEGEARAVVVAAGNHTYLADAIRLADAADASMRTCRRVLGAFRAVWNACVVWACFAVLIDAVTGYVFSYSGGGVFLRVYGSVVMFVMGFMGLSNTWLDLDTWEDRRQRQRRLANGGRDPEDLKGLMRRLAALRREGKISEDTVQRCRDLFVVEPVSDELGTALENYLRGMPSDD
ncbi:hypothetical protein ACQ4PT_060596 [Festuca glaucescens]